MQINGLIGYKINDWKVLEVKEIIKNCKCKGNTGKTNFCPDCGYRSTKEIVTGPISTHKIADYPICHGYNSSMAVYIVLSESVLNVGINIADFNRHKEEMKNRLYPELEKFGLEWNDENFGIWVRK